MKEEPFLCYWSRPENYHPQGIDKPSLDFRLFEVAAVSLDGVGVFSRLRVLIRGERQ